mmetsp:Transcript_8288/g.12564  ORF Transcript_8288/g.12564 Transcript_8288/m.12564 type:complete len:80 (-) Transcript_8288:70-309(-)
MSYDEAKFSSSLSSSREFGAVDARKRNEFKFLLCLKIPRAPEDDGALKDSMASGTSMSPTVLRQIECFKESFIFLYMWG